MKVYIGPYKHWIGPYQLVGFLKYFGCSEATIDKIADKLDHGRFAKFCEWIHNKRKGGQEQVIKVRIDPYDTWSMDHTLGHIILPMLKQLKENAAGAGMVADEDVPDELKLTSAPPKQHWCVDDNHFKRWNYVLDEMIWAFEYTLDEFAYDPNQTLEEYKILDAREKNGFRLFGKYYKNLWE
jgi:hypothetical protein